MKVLVLSDSHGVILDSQIIEIQEHGKYDILIHCGDKYKDAQKFADKLNIDTVYQVPGNCDFDVHNKELVITKVIKNKKLLITHGHIHNVKENLQRLLRYAKEKNADVVLYGHTHQSQNEIIDNILFFNPGSTIFPKDGRASFGILEISDDKIISSIESIKN
ncbi:MAG: metallophosphoesterase [Sedimentibacter sp.]|uniref:metallophosphoesterase n=1 Tax=Sedimentibacter sp. TaxID=1960295 RepID=UPI0029811228|nr:metallophosphoesterase [Sedimentibacter sp.]MDW5299110.1 metallophosphoesterase [Sedimentibacter sp.]